MKIILINDDGYFARGIKEVKKVLSEYKPVIVAPLTEMSSQGHGITLRDNLTVTKIEDDVYAVHGKPADCTLWAVDQVFMPDLIVSGINHGSNLAQDIYYSGTVAAAREACFRGCKGIAISLVNKDDENGHFETAAWVLKEIINSKILSFVDNSILMNINVPDIPLNELKGVKMSGLGWRNYQAKYKLAQDNEYRFLGSIEPIKEIKGTDTFYTGQGYASISFLKLPESKALMDNEEIISELEKIKYSGLK